MTIEFNSKVLRQIVICDIDLECRPLSWYGGDYVTKEITAFAWKCLHWKKPKVWVLRHQPTERLWKDYVQDGLSKIVEDLVKADIITGHYIRGFDLPILSGSMIEHGLNPLPNMNAQDTKLDLPRFQGLSKSQENLAAILRLEHEKVQMNQGTWRSANRLTKEGIDLSRKRVVGDVEQHIEFRQALLDRKMLSPAKMWYSFLSGRDHGYQA